MKPSHIFHAIVDAGTWASIIAILLSSSYIASANNYLLFLAILHFIAGMFLSFASTSVDIEQKDVERIKDQSSNYKAYCKYSYIVESFGMAACGLFGCAFMHLVGGSAMLQWRQKVEKLIENKAS